MGVTLIPSDKFMFGVANETPRVPAGFVLHEAPGEWTTATGPDGREWFVGKSKLILKTADNMCDERETISIYGN